MTYFNQTNPPGSGGAMFLCPGGFSFSSSRNVTHFNQNHQPGWRKQRSSDRAVVLSRDVWAAALLRRERKSFGFRRACGEERRKLVARPILHARGIFQIFALFHAGFLVRARGVTLGSAQTRQGRCLCTLPKGMIPFGNLFCCRLLIIPCLTADLFF